jgi:hypothetical protein
MIDGQFGDIQTINIAQIDPVQTSSRQSGDLFVDRFTCLIGEGT